MKLKVGELTESHMQKSQLYNLVLRQDDHYIAVIPPHTIPQMITHPNLITSEQGSKSKHMEYFTQEVTYAK